MNLKGSALSIVIAASVWAAALLVIIAWFEAATPTPTYTAVLTVAVHPVLHKDGLRGSQIAVSLPPVLADVPDGHKICVEYRMTAHGEFFISPGLFRAEQFTCPMTVWRVNRQWFGHLNEPVDRFSITGYSEIPKGDVPVSLNNDFVEGKTSQ